MDLLDYLRLFRRRWRLVAACVLVSGVAAWLVTPAEPANDNVTYAATHQILRDTSAAAPPALATVALYIKTGDVPVRVAERVGYRGQPAVLAGGVTLEPDEQVGTLEITARGTSPEEATDRANAFAEETLAMLGEQARESQEEQIRRSNERLTGLQADIDDLNEQILATGDGQAPGVLQAERDSKLRQYGAALDQQTQVLNQPPPSAGYVTLQEALPELARAEGGGFSAPQSRTGRTALAATVGLLLGLAAALVLERLDTRLHEPEDIAAAFGLPLIAEVPNFGRAAKGGVLVARDPMSATAEAYRTLRASLLLSPITHVGLAQANDQKQRAEPKVILVSSPAPGDGKTTTAVNLAAAMAETGRKVLLLGCDFRRPEIHRYFDCPAAPGIADVLTREGALRLPQVIVSTDVEGVFLAPSGDRLRNFGDVASAGRQLVEEARGLADVVIIDTPPLLATNDASELIPACDAVVIVSRVAKTTRDGARRSRFLLDRLGAPVAGVIAIGVAERASSYSSYYTSSGKKSGDVAPTAAATGPASGDAAIPAPSASDATVSDADQAPRSVPELDAEGLTATEVHATTWRSEVPSPPDPESTARG
jgi:capsular exopolysaccharide synthesis family protein